MTGGDGTIENLWLIQWTAIDTRASDKAKKLGVQNARRAVLRGSAASPLCTLVAVRCNADWPRR